MLRAKNTKCFIFGHEWKKDCDMPECEKEKCIKCSQECINSGGKRIYIENL
jgi:hypothetical protein